MSTHKCNICMCVFCLFWIKIELNYWCYYVSLMHCIDRICSWAFLRATISCWPTCLCFLSSGILRMWPETTWPRSWSVMCSAVTPPPSILPPVCMTFALRWALERGCRGRWFTFGLLPPALGLTGRIDCFSHWLKLSGCLWHPYTLRHDDLNRCEELRF